MNLKGTIPSVQTNKQPKKTVLGPFRASRGGKYGVYAPLDTRSSGGILRGGGSCAISGTEKKKPVAQMGKAEFCQ